MKSHRPARPVPDLLAQCVPAYPADPLTPRSRRRTRLSAVALACALALSGGACTLRLGPDTPDALPGMSQEQAQRDALARQTVLIASTAHAVSQSSGEKAAGSLEAAASAQLQALGGVWEPWPSGAPSGYPTASPVATADASASTQDLVAALTDGATMARAAALKASDPRQASLYAALTVSWSASLETLSPGSLTRTPRTPSSLTAPLPDSVLIAYDAARYALEDVSARASGETRTSNQKEAAKLRTVVDVSLSLGGKDVRSTTYTRPQASDGLDADTTWAQQVWEDVAAAEIASIAGGSGSTSAASAAPAPGSRQAALDAAVDAALHAQAWGAQTPALPGFAG